VRFEDLIRGWHIIGDLGDDTYRVEVRDQEVQITEHDAMLERAIRASRQFGAAVCKSEWKWRTRGESDGHSNHWEILVPRARRRDDQGFLVRTS
jgi:hypothetical protein